MLHQTRYTKKDLINCGIKKADLRVRTPFDYKHKGWDYPSITLFNNTEYIKFKILRSIIKLGYGVVITLKDNKPCHLSIFADNSFKGLNVFDINKNIFVYQKKGLIQ